MSTLITGGTGSFGQAMTRKLLEQGESRVVIYSRDEVKQDAMRVAFGDDPRLRFFLGDVRDKDRLKRAMHGIDTVYHAAALKRVPQGEYNPDEVIKTNVFGTMHVCDAAIDQGVKCVVALSTDKACLDYHTLVTTDQGLIPISRIVRNQMAVKVLSFNGSGFEWRAVDAWHQTPLGGRKMYRLSYKRQHSNSQAGPMRVLLTNDHPVLTERGWTEAQAINNDDRIATQEVAPNGQQMEVLLGTVLGDASLTSTKNGGRSALTMGQCLEQEEWLDIKCRALAALKVRRKKTISASRGRQPFVRAASPTQAALGELHDIVYGRGGKRVPRALMHEHFSPRLLAAWFLDDGCCSDGTLRLATHGFVREDVEWLAAFLTERGFPATCYRWKTGYHELRFGVESAKLVCDAIGRFVPPSMRYKIPHPAPDYVPESWDTGAADTYFGRAQITEESDYHPKDVYCLGVEGTHNFVANGVVVHNCTPVNLYGASKLVLEKLVVASNAYAPGQTRFMAVRYGNVAGSRGSVIPLWRDTIAVSLLPSMTSPAMTRFWITLPDAVALAQRAATEGKGGEVFIPHLSSYRLDDLWDAMVPRDAVGREAGIWMGYGLRPGEKMHEAMLSEDELHLARDYGTHLCLHPSYAWVEQRTDGQPVLKPLTSDTAPRLSVAELTERLKDV